MVDFPDEQDEPKSPAAETDLPFDVSADKPSAQITFVTDAGEEYSVSNAYYQFSHHSPARSEIVMHFIMGQVVIKGYALDDLFESIRALHVDKLRCSNKAKGDKEEDGKLWVAEIKVAFD